MATVGYERVSTADQNTDHQLQGVATDIVFTDKASGKDTNRPELERALQYVRAGDVFVVHNMDRLDRNLADLRSIVNQLTSKGGSGQVSQGAADFHRRRQSYKHATAELAGVSCGI